MRTFLLSCLLFISSHGPSFSQVRDDTGKQERINYEGQPDSSGAYIAWNDSGYVSNIIRGFHLGITAGAWAPTGNLSALKSRGYLGFTLGHRADKVMFDATITVRFGSSTHNDVWVLNQDTLSSGSYNAGGYLGADWGYQLYRKKGRELDLLWGAGLDLSTIEIENTILNTYRSLNLNAGIGYTIILRHITNDYMDKYTCLAFQAKYNFLGYQNPGGTDLSGNAVTLGLVFGTYRHAYYHNYGFVDAVSDIIDNL